MRNNPILTYELLLKIKLKGALKMKIASKLFFYTLAIIGFAITVHIAEVQAMPSPANSELSKNCELNTTKKCEWDTSNSLLDCKKCYATDTSSNKDYSGTSCRKKGETTPSDDQLETKAGENAVASCNKSKRDDAMGGISGR